MVHSSLPLIYASLVMSSIALLLFIIKHILSKIYKVTISNSLSLKSKNNILEKQNPSISFHTYSMEQMDIIFIIKTLDIAAYVVSWYSVSIGMTLFNKWFLNHWNQTGFPFSITMTWFHMTIKFWFSRIITSYFNFRIEEIPDNTYWKLCVPIGICTAADIMFSNLSLIYISVTFYTITKAGGNVWNLLFSIMLGLQEPSLSLLAVVILICIGIALASYGAVNFILLGFILVLLASIIGTLRWVLTQYLLKRIKNNNTNNDTANTTLTVIYNISPASALSLFPVAMAFEFKQIAKSNLMDEPFMLFISFLLVLCGGILAILLIIIEIMLVKKTSALSLGIIGNFKDIIQILLAVLIFGDHLSSINIIGLIFAFCGMTLYTVIKNSNLRQETNQEYTNVALKESCG